MLRARTMTLAVVLIAGLLPVLSYSAPPARAAVLTVTRTGDPPPDGCRAGDCSLREAVIAANNRPGPDTIRLPRGRYELTRAIPDEDLANSGDLDIAKNVTIAGAGRGRTVIDGNGNDRIFHTYSTVDDVVISDLAIKGGSRVVDEAQEHGGGGILNLGRMKLANVLIENNKVRVDGYGGGISNQGRLVISNSRITANRAPGEGIGGGIDNTVGRLTMRNSRVDHNRAAGSFGGGIYNGLDSQAKIVNSRIDHNRLPSACCGGGIYTGELSTLEVVDSSINSNSTQGCCGAGLAADDAEVLVRGSRIKGNLIEGCCGGGLMAQGESDVVLRGTLIARNKAEGCCAAGLIIQGEASAKLVNSRVLNNRVLSGCCSGGLRNQGDGRLTIVGTLIRGNQSPFGGGGIDIDTGADLSLVMRKSTVAKNSTGGDGGGIRLSDDALASITNSTISGNVAGALGGGIWEDTTGEVTLIHVTITKNQAAGPGGGISTNGGTWSILRTIVGNNSDDCNAILTGPTGKNLDEDSTCFGNAAAIHRNPRLKRLADNGGKTPTHVPRRSSRAVDAALGSTCPPPPRDQRGVRRPQNGDGEPGRKCDLGAVERKP